MIEKEIKVKVTYEVKYDYPRGDYGYGDYYYVEKKIKAGNVTLHEDKRARFSSREEAQKELQKLIDSGEW